MLLLLLLPILLLLLLLLLPILLILLLSLLSVRMETCAHLSSRNATAACRQVSYAFTQKPTAHNGRPMTFPVPGMM